MRSEKEIEQMLAKLQELKVQNVQAASRGSIPENQAFHNVGDAAAASIALKWVLDKEVRTKEQSNVEDVNVPSRMFGARRVA